MNNKKSGSSRIAGVLFAVLALAVGFFAANIGAVLVILKRNLKKMKQHENENNFMETYLFQKEEHSLNADIQNAYITSLNSSVRIMIPKPEKERMNIELLSFASKVDIELPAGVTVHCKGSDDLSFDMEGLSAEPVINLIINDAATALTIGFAGEEDKAEGDLS